MSKAKCGVADLDSSIYPQNDKSSCFQYDDCKAV